MRSVLAAAIVNCFVQSPEDTSTAIGAFTFVHGNGTSISRLYISAIRSQVIV